jgi:hypothetical protein
MRARSSIFLGWRSGVLGIVELYGRELDDVGVRVRERMRILHGKRISGSR